MPIRYSSVVGGSSSAGFNLDVGSSGNTTFVFSEAQPAGGYSITSQLTDASIEFYAIAEDGTLAGYTNTKALSAAKDFDTLVVYGATTNDLITFEYKPTTLSTASGDQDSGAAPFITSVSDADLANIDDTTIITGGNFATDVAVTFTGTDSVVRNAKSVVRTNSTQLIVTRPDEFLPDNAAYTMTVANPGITQSAIVTNTSSITAGGNPVWVTSAGTLAATIPQQAYSVTVEATDPDGGAITYSVVAGQLPAGLSLNSSTGEISGIATGTAPSFTIAAIDSGGNSVNRSFEIPATLAFGGTETTIDGYRVHTFTASGTFELYQDTNLEYLIVAGGGGGGGGRHCGAGGGGGVLELTQSNLNTGSYAVVVGGGGSGGVTSGAAGAQGSSSSVFGTSTTGGGYGAGHPNGPEVGGNGASAGSNGHTPGNGGTAISGQGNVAGNTPNRSATGGGGGAAAPGANGVGSETSSTGTSGNGGAGRLTTITGSNLYFGGGGGGSASPQSPSYLGAWVAGSGGIGGGGGGAVSSNAGTAGVGGGSSLNSGQDGARTQSTNACHGGAGGQNSGGGGGGAAGWSTTGNGNGGTGGSGVVIIRYPI